MHAPVVAGDVRDPRQWCVLNAREGRLTAGRTPDRTLTVPGLVRAWHEGYDTRWAMADVVLRLLARDGAAAGPGRRPLQDAI
ncbi:hypothetical protein [Streptomyces sp. NPDC057460]|uniref:hypothetical protein n=1 Tax=Streptomyces sp. NPDC057460 TaxID=3346141 RepID=UPI00368F4C72